MSRWFQVDDPWAQLGVFILGPFRYLGVYLIALVVLWVLGWLIEIAGSYVRYGF